MNFIKNLLLDFPLLTAKVIRQYFYARQFSRQILKRIPPAYSFNPDRYPTVKYEIFYGTLVPVNLHEKIARLHGVPYNQGMRQIATAQAIITGIYDDLIDDRDTSPERINTILYSENFQPANPWELLCREYFDIITQSSINKKLFDKVVPALIRVQEESKKQRDPNINEDDIMQITQEKGGYAMLFYRTSIPLKCNTEEYNFLYALGGLLQMTNDINDAYKDFQSGSMTIMHIGWPIEKIENVFKNQIEDVRQKWAVWQKKDNRINSTFFSRINVILSRSLLTLELYKTELSAGSPKGPFEIKEIRPGKMITGIKTPANFFSWYRQWIALQNKFTYKTTNF